MNAPFPFARLNGLFPGSSAAITPPATALPPPPAPRFPVTAPLEKRTHQRRKLWALPHKCHCPLIGTCFEVDALRQTMARVMHFPRDTSDFVLHTTAVGACEERTPLAELLHKALEKRYARHIQDLKSLRTPDELAAIWEAALSKGQDIPGLLWSIWTHPACDSALEHTLYGDIHMLQHQIGSGARADLDTLRRLQQRSDELQRQLEASRQENAVLRQEKSRETRNLADRITALRIESTGKDAMIANLSSELSRLRETLPDLKDRQQLARRMRDAEARASTLTQQVRTLENLLASQQRPSPLPPQLSPPSPCPGHTPEPAHLDGRCILCVGGRSGSVDAYRERVEQHGGRFLHHDGGIEESLHRIDAALAAADLVICQAGCISHNAYWRVKEQCKRSGKPCIYLKAAGTSSFERIIRSVCDVPLEAD
ncbi:DUF2325 domain-containing protein [Dechloromonas sp. ZS-1]|uniref:DUF2325 domain-containing protein n=1 Tax=Dechloromonas sp. ZS-1 TaxID=3138067 RepID=UPI0031FDE450